MKIFTDTDKEVINRIISIESYSFRVQDLLKVLFPETLFIRIRVDQEVNQENGFPIFQFVLGYNDPDSHQQNLTKLYNINITLNYLIAEGYITVVGNLPFEVAVINSEYERDANPIWVMNDNARQDLFDKCFYEYKSTEELIALVKNKYLSRTERTAINARNIAFVACFGTLISGFCAVYTIRNSNAFKNIKPGTSQLEGNIKNDTTATNLVLNTKLINTSTINSYRDQKIKCP